MRLQLLSDLHLETEPLGADWPLVPADGAELLVLAGDIDSTWAGLDHFAHWPVPVLMVAGNHEFDQRDWHAAWAQLRARCAERGITLLEREEHVLTGRDGRRIRFLGTTRWCDFDVYGPAERERCLRAAQYFVKVMRATRDGQPFDAAAVRDEALVCRQWLQAALQQAPASDGDGATEADATVVITHYAPSLRSADPRYGRQPGTASFCNADDDLLPWADLWLHGHLHCRHDYRVEHDLSEPAVPATARRTHTRVVSNARGHSRRGEAGGYDAGFCIDV